jgi:hypothetical protein
MSLLERFLKRRDEKAKSLEQERLEGNQAAMLLRDGIFSKIVADMRERIINSWSESPLRDVEAREILRIEVELLDKLVKNIEDTYITGALAAQQLEKEAEKKRKKRGTV